jgi:hypothetical protein
MTALTPAQQHRLSEFERDEGARVVGWSEERSGPILLRGDGALTVVAPTGRISTRRSARGKTELRPGKAA